MWGCNVELRYQDSDECKQAGITYHLTALDEWNAQKDGETYAPAPFADERFIHCTNGLTQLIDVANLFYLADPRERVVLVLEVDRLTAPVRYDDDAGIFPHIYGEINTDAVIGELSVQRAEDGTFLSIGAE